ncbi:MAG: NAD(P)/FAD-dependent oxidoreductase [Chitinophagaceae bacterium]
MKTALIIGAGPAGLTAAFELLVRTDIIPIIVEADHQVGGLSKTVDYHGNKMDIGGHRFFSKSAKVIEWWQQFLPLEAGFDGGDLHLQYQNQNSRFHYTRSKSDDDDKVMLVRKRKSRIYYQNRLFDYPLRLNLRTLRNLGLVKTVRVFFSYLYAQLFPQRSVKNLEQFFINRFGKELYHTFFKDYTEKVWGVPCSKLPASWGQQRVKDLNIGKVIGHAIRSIFTINTRIDQKGTSTSLIEQFLYPKFGPGQMWETVTEEIKKRGGQVLLNAEVTAINGDGKNNIRSVEVTDITTGSKTEMPADYFISTMPVKYLIGKSKNLTIPERVRQVAANLEYRDFLIVGILTNDLLLKEKDHSSISDNWIYIQDKNIRAGRLQFFHNWSPYMVAQPGSNWIGVEYFCNDTDPFWKMNDRQISQLAVGEMKTIGVLDIHEVKDTVVVRVRKAYPSYYGSFEDFSIVKDYLNTIENLFPIGRNGMHRYNNSDHSMLTAMAAVDNIVNLQMDKTNIWDINTDETYHEEQSP